MPRILAIFVIAAVLLSGCGVAETRTSIVASTPTALPVATPAPVPTTENDPLRRDAEMFATQTGISVDDAMQRLSQQDAIGDLDAQLTQAEAATFAGLWIEQTPRYRVVVAFTRDGEQTVKRYVAGTPLAALIEVRTASVTLAALQAEQQALHDLLGRLGMPFSSGIDVQSNQITLYVTDRERFDAALQQANATLPPHVVAETVYEPLREPPVALTPVPNVFFPQFTIKSSSFTASLFKGELVVEDGCLRVRSDQENVLVIWQPDFFLNDNAGTIEVINYNGEVVGRVGEPISMGGGERPMTSELARQLREPLPTACQGPYWLADVSARLGQ